MLEHTFPQEWYVTEQTKRHANLTHTHAVYSTQWRMHIISLFTFVISLGITSSCESIHINASKISIRKPRFLNIASVVM